MEAHGDSMIGLRRTNNEDQFFIMSFEHYEAPRNSEEGHLDPPARTTGYLLGVADGIGGAPAGERASLVVTGTLKQFIREESARLLQTGRTDGETMETLNQGLRTCQAALAEEVQQHPEHWGMGTTLTAAVILWPRLFLFHLGDSRAYLLRGGVLRRLSQDQTVARSLADAGILDAGSEQLSRWRHVVWNCLGGRASGSERAGQPEVHIEDLRREDTLLLCTNGLSNTLTDKIIRDLLVKGGSPKDLSDSILHSARNQGAKDDTTVVIARFEESQMNLESQ